MKQLNDILKKKLYVDQEINDISDFINFFDLQKFPKDSIPFLSLFDDVNLVVDNLFMNIFQYGFGLNENTRTSWNLLKNLLFY